ncbi:MULTISPECIES: YgaP family membrane protein [Hydrogenophaga]|uniref:Sulfurtransferase n=1 Tax=Hydrogenophaga electricum TaxID=1230953 RepID=A0ABQ6C8E9_9BURK|nr:MULTISPECIES: DUF2892 domain-containing protein [Hydrogenophaga]GLS16653.1 sulfurtransferase [Hydrogenophaga electricum]
MTVERCIRILAGFVVMLSLALGVEGSPIFVNQWFLALTAFAGFNLFQSGITGFCPPAFLFRKLGIPDGGGHCGSGKCQ